MKKTAQRINNFESSAIRKAFALAGKIKNPINLSIGRPDFDVPEIVKNAAIKSIKKGFNKYTPTNGILELREKIAVKLQNNGINIDPSEVLVTAGTTGAIFLSYLALLDPGDEVIVFDPYFVAYKQLAELLGAKVKIIDTYPDFQPNIKELKKTISAKTKLIVLNSPNNPAGAVYVKKKIKEVVEIARKNDIYLLSDEVYEDFIYEGGHFSPGSIYKNTLTLNGFSKSISATGWRIGYVAGPKDIIDKMASLQQFIFVCAPSFAQHAVIKALDYDNKKEVAGLRQKRDFLYENLKDFYDIAKPAGAFYLFLKTPYEEEKFISELLKHKVIVVPGSAFSDKKGYIRISYACPTEILKKAVKILQSLTKSFWNI